MSRRVFSLLQAEHGCAGNFCNQAFIRFDLSMSIIEMFRQLT